VIIILVKMYPNLVCWICYWGRTW